MAAVVLVDMAQTVQLVWARSDAKPCDASTLSRGASLLNGFAPRLCLWKQVVFHEASELESYSVV